VLAVLGGSGSFVSSLTLGGAAGRDAWRLLQRVKSWEGVGGVCRALAPLPPVEPSPPTTGYSDLRQVALARLLVDNIDSIQVDWSRHGPKLAQVALTFGADDVDAVPAVSTSEQGWRRSPREEIRRNITAAGFSPVPRNGRFEALES
jgi:aminodeoxyfutalosine synthase